MPHAVVAAPIVLAAVLALSGVAKLRDHERSTQSVMVLLRLPSWLLKPWTATTLPWGEIVLAALLVLAPSGVAMWVAAVAALLLTGAYWAVVARAMTFDPRPVCGCFGRIGNQQITAQTLWRNTILVALAGATVAMAAMGTSTLRLLTDGSDAGQTWAWLVALAVVGALVTLIVHVTGTTAAPATSTSPSAVGEDDDEDGDYVRQPIPLANLTDPEGEQHTLWEISRARAQLLVFVNCYCASSGVAFEALPRWQALLPAVDVRFVFSIAPQKLAVASGQLDTSASWVDHGGVTWEALGLTRSPSAVLLGTDRLIAGGPVDGNDDVEEFVADIAEALSGVVLPDPDATEADGNPAVEGSLSDR